MRVRAVWAARRLRRNAWEPGGSFRAGWRAVVTGRLGKRNRCDCTGIGLRVEPPPSRRLLACSVQSSARAEPVPRGPRLAERSTSAPALGCAARVRWPGEVGSSSSVLCVWCAAPAQQVPALPVPRAGLCTSAPLIWSMRELLPSWSIPAWSKPWPFSYCTKVEGRAILRACCLQSR